MILTKMHSLDGTLLTCYASEPDQVSTSDLEHSYDF